MNIFHITTRKAWIDATRLGRFSAPSLETDGMIHASTLRQILPVAAQFYRGQTGLVILELDPRRLTSELKWEPPAGGSLPPGVPEGDAFPHIYGPINLDAVVRVLDFKAGQDGQFTLPPALEFPR